MSNPSALTTVTIGENRFNALSVQFGVTTLHDHLGMPQMGTVAFSVSLTADMHDTRNLSFVSLQKLFMLANGVTRDKVQEVRIEYWSDERRVDALCVYSFRGWLSSFFTISAHGENHVVSMTIQPELTNQQFAKVAMSN